MEWGGEKQGQRPQSTWLQHCKGSEGMGVGFEVLPHPTSILMKTKPHPQSFLSSLPVLAHFPILVFTFLSRRPPEGVPLAHPATFATSPLSPHCILIPTSVKTPEPVSGPTGPDPFLCFIPPAPFPALSGPLPLSSHTSQPPAGRGHPRTALCAWTRGTEGLCGVDWTEQWLVADILSVHLL